MFSSSGAAKIFGFDFKCYAIAIAYGQLVSSISFAKMQKQERTADKLSWPLFPWQLTLLAAGAE